MRVQPEDVSHLRVGGGRCGDPGRHIDLQASHSGRFAAAPCPTALACAGGAGQGAADDARDERGSECGFSPKTCRTYGWVGADVATRADTLTFKHHIAVASLPPPVQLRWLARVEQGKERPTMRAMNEVLNAGSARRRVAPTG